MNNLFKKAMVFSDIHYGLKNNSVVHLDDCMDYIEWFILEAKKKSAETCICMGDFFHHRNTINSQTLEYGIKAFQRLNDEFDHTYIIVGNHDLYWRESRAITSVKFASLYPKITLVDSLYTNGNVSLIPWLVKDEWKDVVKLKSKYIFGHLELPGFKMNAQIEMPDHGELNSSHFKNQDHVFSGHFHIRQIKGKISYIGNPFGHNYSDVWDFNRGAMYLEWDKEPEYINYEAGPRYINLSLSTLIADPTKYLLPKTHLQVTLDIDISYEEAISLRESFMTDYNIRELKLINSKDSEIIEDVSVDASLKPVDQIVSECILALDKYSKFDISKLIEIYQGL